MRTSDCVNAVTYLETRHYLVSTLLRDTDQMSMANSVEVRVPLLDHRLVEFVMRVPGSLKVGRRIQKPLLFRALDGALPETLRSQSKRTFTFPWAHWLRGELQPEVDAALREPAPTLLRHLSSATTAQVWADFLAHRTTWSRPWALYVLNAWVRTHLDT